MQHAHVVCFGGGTGLSTLLRGLKKYVHPTAIVSMADSGGHSGILRDELGLLPPGDVRACLVALADDKKSPLLRDLFSYRFTSGSHVGANVGNLLLAALSDIKGDFNQAVEAAHALLELQGQVIPVTLEATDLLAELEDGTILFGEKVIGLPRSNGHMRIKRVWLQPKVPANSLAVQAIKEADLLVFGPGDLFTSILPNLYVDGIQKAIQSSKAKLVYVANIMTKHGETDDFTVETFVQELEHHLPRAIDTVLYNTEPVPDYLLKRYKKEKAKPVTVAETHKHWLGAPILSTAGDLARHDSEKVAAALAGMITSMQLLRKEDYARVA